jgi:hypothetical protein
MARTVASASAKCPVARHGSTTVCPTAVRCAMDTRVVSVVTQAMARRPPSRLKPPAPYVTDM